MSTDDISLASRGLFFVCSDFISHVAATWWDDCDAVRVVFKCGSAGLEDQLLNITVEKEEPEMQRQKDELVLDAAANARKLKEIEDKIDYKMKKKFLDIFENLQ